MRLKFDAQACREGCPRRGRPDFDGLGVVAEILTRDRAQPLLWWSGYHHVLAHKKTVRLVVIPTC